MEFSKGGGSIGDVASESPSDEPLARAECPVGDEFLLDATIGLGPGILSGDPPAPVEVSAGLLESTGHVEALPSLFQLALEGSREDAIGRVAEYLSGFFHEVQPLLSSLLLSSLFPFS